MSSPAQKWGRDRSERNVTRTKINETTQNTLTHIPVLCIFIHSIFLVHEMADARKSALFRRLFMPLTSLHTLRQHLFVVLRAYSHTLAGTRTAALAGAQLSRPPRRSRDNCSKKRPSFVACKRGDNDSRYFISGHAKRDSWRISALQVGNCDKRPWCDA